MSALADKLVYKNGKVIEGIVQEEFPSSVKFLFQGRVLVIPRDRIDKLEKETGSGNVGTLLTQADAAIRSTDLQQAQALLDKATELNGAEGPFTAQIKEMTEKLKARMAEGSAAERRKRAELLLQEATARFDRIQNQKGMEALMQALEIDPDLTAAHDLMAKFMRNNRPELPVVIKYFCDYVDPAKINQDHPVLDWLPQVYVELRQQLMAAKDPKEVKTLTTRLMKVSAAFDQFPKWAEKATSAQKTLIDMRGDGVVQDLVTQNLDGRNFQGALDRLTAWAPPDRSADIARFYIRAYIGMGSLQEAKQAMEAAIKKFPDAAWAEKTQNAINFYISAVEATQNNNHKDARAILTRLYSLRQELLPEIYYLVSLAKVGYDVADLQSLEGSGDATGAADLAIQIHGYVSDKKNRQLAADAFHRLAPQVAFNLKLVWVADGHEVPLHKQSTDFVRDALAQKFNLHFKEESPFTLTLKLVNATYTVSGARIVEAAGKDQTWEVDLFNPDDSVTKMRIEATVSHPAVPVLYTATQEISARAQGATKGEDKGAGLFVYFYLTQMKDVDEFLKSDFSLYLAPETATIGSNLKLPEK